MTIIGVAGGTGSGKTTVVKKIVEALPPHYVAVVALDSYYNDESTATPEERKTINVDHPNAFDWPLLTAHVKALRAGQPIEMPMYSYSEFSRLPQTEHVEPRPVVIVEGIMVLLNKELRDMMDLKIYVDTDSDERFIRNLQRDVIERGRTVDMVIDRYLSMKKPMHELIIPQGGENNIGIEILRKYIEGIATKP